MMMTEPGDFWVLVGIGVFMLIALSLFAIGILRMVFNNKWFPMGVGDDEP
jgi:hypothetical protein